MPSVWQDWVMDLSYQQQGVLATGVRGCDGVRKYHDSKFLQRWIRRAMMRGAYEGGYTFPDNLEPGGGSFMGPVRDLEDAKKKFFNTIDELPFHYVMHMLHTVEIIGYKHPEQNIASWFCTFYYQMCRHMHLEIETAEDMNWRLNDKDKEGPESAFVSQH